MMVSNKDSRPRQPVTRYRRVDHLSQFQLYSIVLLDRAWVLIVGLIQCLIEPPSHSGAKP